jgi:hypothetical protein
MPPVPNASIAMADEMTTAQLRTALRDRDALPSVAPLALTMVEQEPFLRAQEHRGDLLEAVAAVPHAFWAANLQWFDRLYAVMARIRDAYLSLDQADWPIVDRVGHSLATILAEGIPTPNRSPSGPTALNKLCLQSQPQYDECWHADSWQVDEDGKRWLTWVTHPASDLIVTHRVSEGAPSPELLWDTLVQAMLYPASGPPRRPTYLRIAPERRWQTLRPHLAEAGILIDEIDSLDLVDGLPELMDRVYREGSNA